MINAKDGSIAGTIDLGGAPEQAVTDGKGHIYVDIEDKDNIAVVDAKTMTVTGHYDLAGKGGGLRRARHGREESRSCSSPAASRQIMVIMSAEDGKILDTLPIGAGTDGAVFNPEDDGSVQLQGDGTLTVIKENSPTSFVVEQNRAHAGARQDADAGQQDRAHPADHRRVHAASAPATPPPAGGRGGRGVMVPDSFSIIVVGK